MAHEGDEVADETALAGHAGALVDAVGPAVQRWVTRVVASRYEAWSGAPPGAELRAAAELAAAAARTEVEPAVTALLRSDVDRQTSNPLALVRAAVRYPTAVLAGAGVPEVERDAFAERAFPEDRYDLSPASFADVDPELRELGLVWGAAKAHVILARRRREGRR